MGKIAASVVTASAEASGPFTPASSVFIVHVISGMVRIQMLYPGEEFWTFLCEVRGGESTPVVHKAGSAVPISVDVPGYQYRLVPSFESTAYATE